jgi:MFS transporter, FSR family, fosmidomycin resistance protein
MDRMKNTLANGEVSTTKAVAETTVFPILFAISFSHMLNDTIQSLIPAIYPIVKDSFQLSFTQIGLITLTNQLTASVLQPFVGYFTDKRPKPYALVIGMAFTLAGLLLLAGASSFYIILLAVGMVGIGSSVFHPEASRVAHLASGGRRGMAQSLFQVGGNFGTSIGPLLAALIIVPYGQSSVGWFSVVALLAIFVLWQIGRWYSTKTASSKAGTSAGKVPQQSPLPHKQVVLSLIILLFLIFSKYIYMASMTSYFTFYMMDKFQLSVQNAQVYLFVFLFAVAAGTFIGGPLGDRFGRKYVIWASILGVAPFTLILPYASLFYTGVLIVFIGLILSSAFSAILVYAQELIPGKVGMIAGLFFGFAFGVAGIGSALLGELADRTSIYYVFQVCSFLPLIGLITVFLPGLSKNKHHAKGL